MSAQNTSDPSGDEFMDKMWQHMQHVNAECTRMLNELRKQNKLLKTQLDAAKDRYYELIAENVAMQDELVRRRESSEGSKT